MLTVNSAHRRTVGPRTRSYRCPNHTPATSLPLRYPVPFGLRNHQQLNTQSKRPEASPSQRLTCPHLKRQTNTGSLASRGSRPPHSSQKQECGAHKLLGQVLLREVLEAEGGEGLYLSLLTGLDHHLQLRLPLLVARHDCAGSSDRRR